MKIPAKAIILAAGFGTRIRPLSFQTPKPLLPLWGKPILSHTLDTLARWGVKEVLINLHHSASAMFDHVLRDKPAGIRIEFSFEPDILGTGGALSKAAWFLDDSCFWIVNGDIAFDLDSRYLLKTFETGKPLSVLWMTATAGPRTVEMSDGVVTNFNSSRSGSAGTHTFCGVHLVSPRVLDYIPDNTFFSIIEAYNRAMKDGCVVRGVCARKSFWSDIGTLATYLKTHGRVYEAYKRDLPGSHLFQPEQLGRLASLGSSGVVIKGFASIGRNVQVAGSSCKTPFKDGHDEAWPSKKDWKRTVLVLEGCASSRPRKFCKSRTVIEDSVIWDDAEIASGSFVKNAVVADGVCVRGNINGMAVVRADATGNPQIPEIMSALGWPLARTAALSLPARGSARTFTRLQHQNQSAMLVQYSLERPENGLYAQNAGLLRSIGVRVPKIFLDMPERNLLVMEDVGDCALLDLVRVSTESPGSTVGRLCLPAPARGAWGQAGESTRRELPETVVKLYRKILESIVVMHKNGMKTAQKGGVILSEPFSNRLYRWERELFTAHFLKNRLHLPSKTIAKVMLDMELVARRLMKEPVVLVHRDLQSTNVLFHRGQPVFIDFQGMRFGPAMYDVASLLCDPYVGLPSSMQDELLAFYAGRMGLRIDDAAESFQWAAVERLVQAIGAYGRLGSLPETAQFSRHIVPGIQMLNRVLAGLDNLSHLKRVVCYAIETKRQF